MENRSSAATTTASPRLSTTTAHPSTASAVTGTPPSTSPVPRGRTYYRGEVCILGGTLPRRDETPRAAEESAGNPAARPLRIEETVELGHVRDPTAGRTRLEDGGKGEDAAGWIPAGKLTSRGRAAETAVPAEAREPRVPSVDAEIVREGAA